MADMVSLGSTIWQVRALMLSISVRPGHGHHRELSSHLAGNHRLTVPRFLPAVLTDSRALDDDAKRFTWKRVREL